MTNLFKRLFVLGWSNRAGTNPVDDRFHLTAVGKKGVILTDDTGQRRVVRVGSLVEGVGVVKEINYRAEVGLRGDRNTLVMIASGWNR